MNKTGTRTMHAKKTYVMTGAALVAGGLLIAAPLSSASAGSSPKNPAGSWAVGRAQVVGASVAVAPGGHGLASVTCPAGKIISGGGGQTSGFDIFFTDSFASGNGWTIRGTNTGTTTQNLSAVAICLGLS
jgi:hypothetical protein